MEQRFFSIVANESNEEAAGPKMWQRNYHQREGGNGRAAAWQHQASPTMTAAEKWQLKRDSSSSAENGARKR